jgi:prepilin signal peptidase PulO-like enzyme (type II secretory pathway)
MKVRSADYQKKKADVTTVSIYSFEVIISQCRYVNTSYRISYFSIQLLICFLVYIDFGNGLLCMIKIRGSWQLGPVNKER